IAAAQNETPKPPKGRSIAHYAIDAKKAVYVSLDIEVGGEYCGVVQLSAEIPNKFNKYVNPGEGAPWTDACTNLHGLHAEHPSIVGADDIAVVWGQFREWLNANTFPDEVGILVAWNGATCDLKWLWKLTQAPRSSLDMPSRLKYFVHLELRVVQAQSEEEQAQQPRVGRGVDVHQGRTNLNGAHDSLVDVIAQTDIIVHPDFVPFINRTQSVQTISDIFTTTQQNEWKKQMEPVREVHAPWKEITKDDNIKWTPLEADSYTGPEGGPDAGPTQHMVGVARSARNLSCLFLAMIPLSFWTKVATMTDKYCYKDWVVEKRGNDRDGNPKKTTYFSHVPAKTGGSNTPGRRHRADDKKKYSRLRPGGGHFGSDKRTARKMWRKPPHGLKMAYVQNTMTRNAYEFMRRYIHFADNARKRESTDPLYDPMWKVAEPLEVMTKDIQLSWNAGKYVVIDKSMIRYKGRAVAFVQYMPAKPIKHGLGKVYAGKGGDSSDGTAVGICNNLAIGAGLTGARGRVLVTDNWYTSLRLAMHFFEKYGWTIVGTINPTDKKSRADYDIPFLKLSRGALGEVKRGWFREAVIEMKTLTGKTCYIQCTTWKDKKQVVFLNSNEIGASDGFSMYRHRRGKKTRDIIDGPRAQADYVICFNGVDRNDRDSANYSTTIRTNRYYLRIFCWGLDRVVHAQYVTVCFLASSGIGPKEWKNYLGKNEGRHDFQIDLAIALMNYAIELDWKSIDERPQTALVPCDCEQCFFCKNGSTNGVAHKKQEKETVVFKCNKRMRTKKCTSVRVTLKEYSDYCWVCCHKLKGKLSKTTKKALTFPERKKMSNRSRKGCAVCQEPICEGCWEEYQENEHVIV
ncbi:hypothetical protein ACHAXT_004792, partial [Thalassiosira profunda]